MSTALVLGGGGPVGMAWQIGLLTGLRSAGVDLVDADLVVGTSAGAAVGALLTSGGPNGEQTMQTFGSISGTLADPADEHLASPPTAGAATGLLDAMAAAATAGSPRASNRALGRLAAGAPDRNPTDEPERPAEGARGRARR